MGAQVGGHVVSPMRRDLNRTVLTIFAPVLIVAGLLGFVVPAELGLVSGAPAYNVFHIVAGAIGLAIVLANHAGLVAMFNLGFGLIDVYQAVASVAHLFPERWFRWTRVDDVLHVVIGLGLILVALAGRPRPVNPGPRGSRAPGPPP